MLQVDIKLFSVFRILLILKKWNMLQNTFKAKYSVIKHNVKVFSPTLVITLEFEAVLFYFQPQLNGLVPVLYDQEENVSVVKQTCLLRVQFSVPYFSLSVSNINAFGQYIIFYQVYCKIKLQTQCLTFPYSSGSDPCSSTINIYSM